MGGEEEEEGTLFPLYIQYRVRGGGLMKWMENGPKYPEEEEEALHERERELC